MYCHLVAPQSASLIWDIAYVFPLPKGMEMHATTFGKDSDIFCEMLYLFTWSRCTDYQCIVHTRTEYQCIVQVIHVQIISVLYKFYMYMVSSYTYTHMPLHGVCVCVCACVCVRACACVCVCDIEGIQ